MVSISSSMAFSKTFTSSRNWNWKETLGCVTTGRSLCSVRLTFQIPTVKQMLLLFFSIHYIVYWLHLHPGVRDSGLLCRSPPEHTGERVQHYVHSYNRGCPKDRQQNKGDQDTTDPELWNTPMEAQGEVEEELEPSHLRVPQKYQIIRLSWNLTV